MLDAVVGRALDLPYLAMHDRPRSVVSATHERLHDRPRRRSRGRLRGQRCPGEFRPLTDALIGEQLAVTLIRVPPHSDFEQGTGHRHDEIEEIYILTRGTLTMRFGDRIEPADAGTAVRVAPATVRSHRNEGDEPVEMWAVSRRTERADSSKIEHFWQASTDADQQR